MRRFFGLIAALLIAAPSWCGGAEPPKVEVEAEPPEFPAGEWTLVSIRIDREVDRRDIRLPKLERAEWHPERGGISRSLNIVNGRSSRSTTYTLPLSSGTPGALTVPPVEVRLTGGRTAQSRPLHLKVLAAGEAPRGAGDPAGRIVVPAGRKNFYAGEEIPVDFELAIPPGIKVRELDFPHMSCDGPVILPDLSRRRTRHPHFLDPVQRERETPEGTMRIVTFRTMLRFMRPGDYKLAAAEVLLAADSRSRRQPRSRPRFGFGFDEDMDDFFSGGGGNTRRVVVNYPALPLKILPVPPPPPGTVALELFGDWQVTPKLSASSVRAGEVLELEVRLDGTGGLAGFRPPKLEFPDFRVYPPELKSEPDGSHSIRYALVPLRPGEYKLDPAFSLLDLKTGRYRTTESSLSLAVTGSPLTPEKPAAAPVPALPPPEKPAAAAPAPVAAEPPPAIPKCGRIPGKWLWRRGLACGGMAAGILGGAALLIELALRRRARKRDVRPEETERRRRVEALIRYLKHGGDALETLHSGGAEALARALGLPSGSTAAELAEKVAEPSLRGLLEESDRDTFAPESERRRPQLSPAGRKEFLKLLKRALSIVLAAAAWQLSAAEPARDRLHLERAVLLAPRDAGLRRALERTARELGETPVAPSVRMRLRDLLRPDEHLMLAGVLLGAACIVLAVLRRRRRRTAFAAAWSGAALAALCCAAAWSQYGQSGGYRGSRAVVTAPELELYSLPADSGGRAVGKLRNGCAAEVLETRGSFIRLRGNGIEGWCRDSGAERISTP